MSSKLLILNAVVKNASISELIILDLELDGEVKWAEQMVNNVQAEAKQKVTEAHDKAQILTVMKAMHEAQRNVKEWLIVKKAEEDQLATEKAKTDRRAEAQNKNKEVTQI